jgi:[ribosomal protein S5]-alanine N-acetyltransferase
MGVAAIKIISGGQTGADRAALDFALDHGIPHGGWCPKGRKAEDGTIDSRYQLKETPSADYFQRTEWNVRDSDGTVVFSIAASLRGGSKETVELAQSHQKPVLHLFRDFGSPFPERELLRFIRDNRTQTLNVAGPRASKEPDVGAFVRVVLDKAWDAAEETSLMMSPEITTDRLVLRALALADAPDVARLAGRREVADTTISIPHPYSEQQARDWITARTGPQSVGKETVFAITLKRDRRLIGGVGLREINLVHSHAEMGFWIGVDWWGQGYATEAARAVVGFAFDQLGLNRVYAHHMVRNPASGRVLAKIGMKPEGLLRQCVRKWDVFEDVVILAIVRADWPQRTGLLCDAKP